MTVRQYMARDAMYSMPMVATALAMRVNTPMGARSMIQWTMVIMAVSIGLGLGVELRPEVLQHLPAWVRDFFGSGLISGGLTALLLNVVLPEDRQPSSRSG